MDPGEHRQADRREQHPAPAASPIRERKSSSAISGVSTTYIPVMKPVLETVVRSSPAVCSAYPAASSRPRSAPADAAAAAQRRTRRAAGTRERQRGDREPHREEREQRVDRDRVLDLDERHAPDGSHRDQRRARAAHRAILSRNRLGKLMSMEPLRDSWDREIKSRARVGHGQVQLPLHLLHAGGGPASGSAATEILSFEEIARARRRPRAARRRRGAADGRRAARAARPADARRRCSRQSKASATSR